MMGFMVLLVVTLATMVQMQMRMSRQTIIDQKARQAAKFAAYQAMNAVQVSLGPDQRITANAMMFDDQLARGITDLDRNSKYTWWENPMDITREDVENIENLSISQNRYWVGVWDSAIGKAPAAFRNDEDRTSYAERMADSALTWLVSGNIVRSENDVEGSEVTHKPTVSLEKGNYVRAVSSGSYKNEVLGSNDIDVRAPIVTLEKDTNAITGEKIEDGKETRIAWWVSDEGQKASLNAVATKEELTHAGGINYRIQGLPFYSGIHALTVSNFGNKSGIKAFDLYFDDDDDQNGSLAKIRNLDDVRDLDVIKSDNVTSSTLPSKIFFHAATFNTKGVLSNTREGGLKKDLSLGLIRKDNGNEPEEPDDDSQETPPEYFERPYGIAGYEYKTSTAYPILPFSSNQSRRNLSKNKLKYRGHMFGPQQYGHEDVESTGVGFDAASALANVMQTYSDTYLYKDPGGPLWDQLRSYYNLRTDDSGEKKLKPRQQTDDRHGFKPIVKRFQVFFVPSFVDYSGASNCVSGDYGVRLHIIPLMVLWNPYDAKIDGDTYYVVRICNLKRSNSLGVFRLAVGYVAPNQRFQCLRDFRTEKIPVQTTWGYNFALKEYNNRGHNYSGGDAKAIFPTASRQYNISENTAWYSRKMYPLGYGQMANPDGYDSGKNYVYQTSSQTEEYTGLKVNDNLLAKVTKVPLYLNNLIVSIEHGNYYTQYPSTYYGFNGQQELDEPNAWSSSYAQDRCEYVVGDLHFVIYDKTGIPAGKAKVFAMTKVLNYLGKPTASVRAGIDGPNGAISVSGSDNVYEKLGAMLRGLDDGGVMGSCFYLDVPHAEVEHIARYNRNRTYDNKPYEVLFNLLEVNQNQRSYGGTVIPNEISQIAVDIQPMAGIWTEGGGNYPFTPRANSTPMHYGMSSLLVYRASGNLASYATINGPWWTSSTASIRSTGDFWRLFLQVYIWKYGSKDVMDISKSGVIYRRGSYGSPYWNQLFTLPSMHYVYGTRIMLNCYQQSFPDPANTTSSNNYFNYFSPGLVVGVNGDTSRNYYVTAFANYDSGSYPDANYFLSWMQINVRRHSANFWMCYGSSTTSRSKDAAPSAKEGLYVATFSNSGYNYGPQLHQHLRKDYKLVPYGYVFGLPYPQETMGFSPIFNRRMFVNSDIMSSAYDAENSPREIDYGDNAYGSSINTLDTTTGAGVYHDIGRMQNTYLGFGLAQGDNDDGISDLGYDVYESGGYVSVGTSKNQGSVYESVTHHILRETEVVSNPAALASSSLTFGIGAIYFGYDKDATKSNEFMKRTSGNQSLQSLQTTFAMGNSLCPSRVAPERNYQVTWMDYSSPWTDGNTDGLAGKPDGKRASRYTDDKTVLYDMSYCLNNILWDEYFFSTLPYRQDEADIAISSDYAMPQNPRLRYYVSDSEKLTSMDLRSSTRDDQFTENASKFWINGPFNINSTSIDAWKTVLATYYNVPVEGYTSGTEANNSAAPFHRYGAPNKATAFTSSSSIANEAQVFDGFRSLDDDELEQLASAIVEHIKDRGPFYSMADFVNRRTDSYAAEQRYNDTQLRRAGLIPASYGDEKKFTYIPQYSEYEDRVDIDDGSTSVSTEFKHKIAHLQKGVLQAAIDATEINYAFHRDDDLIISIENDRNMAETFKYDQAYRIFRNPTDAWENWRGAIGPQLTGAPTYLMQQDILARIGSFLTARSDTFKIRAYGEIRNPISGIVEGKAWCEMVVQRIPEYICAELPNQEAWRVSGREIELGTQNGQRTENGEELDGIMDELEPVNKALGRRFKVVSFRWLNEKEI